MSKKVFVTAFPNIQGGKVITCSGEGSHLKVAIKRALDEVFESDKIKGKRIILPMKLVVTEGDE